MGLGALLLCLTKVMESIQWNNEHYTHQYSTRLNPVRPKHAIEHTCLISTLTVYNSWAGYIRAYRGMTPPVVVTR